MARKKKPKFDIEKIFEEDAYLKEMKKLYFKLLPHEDIPKTPKASKKIDELEKEIEKRKQQIRLEYEDTKQIV